MADIFNNSIKAVIGLGNPGQQYEDTRHNIGFKIVDSFLSTLKGEIKIYDKYSGLYCYKNIGGGEVHFLKPMTYMNLSGNAVKQLAKSETLKPEEIIVVQDDMDFELGTVRLKRAGGSAGHNGIDSIIESLQSCDFIRLRVGIGRVQNDAMREHVLEKFKEDELDILKEVIKLSIEAIRLTLAQDIHTAMNVINAKKIKTT